MNAQYGYAVKLSHIFAPELARLATSHAVIGQELYDPRKFKRLSAQGGKYFVHVFGRKALPPTAELLSPMRANIIEGVLLQ